MLACAATMLNYVNRRIIALLTPTLQVGFGCSNRDYSHMTPTFHFSAALAFLGAGWFIDRVGLRRSFASGAGTWSLAGMAHTVVASVGLRGIGNMASNLDAVVAPLTIARRWRRP